MLTLITKTTQGALVLSGINGGWKNRGQMPALEAKDMLQEKRKSQEICSMLVVGGANVAEDEQHVAGAVVVGDVATGNGGGMRGFGSGSC